MAVTFHAKSELALGVATYCTILLGFGVKLMRLPDTGRSLESNE